MVTTAEHPARPDALARTERPRRFLADLAGQSAFAHIGPNWFAAVMGTGIVANAAATLPGRTPALHMFAVVVWVLAMATLVAVSAATALHWLLNRNTARSHLGNPVMSHFYGAPAMALMTVGAGAVLLGGPGIGMVAAVGLDAVLWTAGTMLGLCTPVAIPYRAFTSHDNRPESAFGGWLMPVVPPMVSAATGTLLIPHLRPGQAQLTMELGCYAMFGLTLVASLIVVTTIWGRLVQHKVGAAAAVPTLWIVLGPVGQSITAAHNLGDSAPTVLPEPFGVVFRAAGMVYGVPMWGFAMLWLALAAAITVRTARRHLPFTLTWWSFTFPVGTVVTGTSALAATTGAQAFAVAAVALYIGLLAAWVIVAGRTVRGVWHGALLLAPGTAVNRRSHALTAARPEQPGTRPTRDR